MSALETLGASAFTLPAAPDTLKLPPPDATSPVPSTDRPPEAHTDLNLQLKELDADESDSSDENETLLGNLISRPPPNKAEVAKEAISNRRAMPQTTMEAAFPPMTTVDAATEAQGTNPFPPVLEKDSSPFPASTPPFAASPEPQKVATLSDLDKVFGNFPERHLPPQGTASPSTIHLKISLTLLQQNQVPPFQISVCLPPPLLRSHQLR